MCDFLFAAPNMPDLGAAVLFQHNVEALIWKRQLDTATSAAHQFYFQRQYDRMLRYEGQVCRAVKSIIAVSEQDARTMRSLYGVSRIAAVPTGVDLDYFTPASRPAPKSDLVFVGSMDWMPNIDGIQWFVRGSPAADPQAQAGLFAGDRGAAADAGCPAAGREGLAHPRDRHRG